MHRKTIINLVPCKEKTLYTIMNFWFDLRRFSLSKCGLNFQSLQLTLSISMQIKQGATRLLNLHWIFRFHYKTDHIFILFNKKTETDCESATRAIIQKPILLWYLVNFTNVLRVDNTRSQKCIKKLMTWQSFCALRICARKSCVYTCW